MSETYPHFMLDIETLGNGPNAAVVQIGAVGFDPTDGRVSLPFKVNVIPNSKSQMDWSTVQWWMGQSEEARKSVFFTAVGGDGLRHSPNGGLEQLQQFIWNNAIDAYSDYQVWAKPSTFDIVILESLYKHCGIRAPWEHWNTRCLRTLIDVSGLPKEEQAVPVLAHDAGEDAKAQALTAIKCYERLRNEKV